MIDFLLGVPGKLKTISDYLTTHLASTRAAKIDQLDASVSSRAPASTALSNVTYTSGRAAMLDNVTQKTEPMLASPIAAGFGVNLASSGAAAGYVTHLSVTGAGLLQYLQFSYGSGGAKAGCRVTIDGVVVYSKTDLASGTSVDLLLSGESVPFHTSLLIERYVSALSGDLAMVSRVRRTA